ncbi:MocR-like pyridoxine biosynthesis transcription factor PdxR [Pseudoduganella sp. RAF53_2]|uniref:MocR-like pyridoxine biosynthesis transcription factor PdxR n=1 Tax=unclassified Pseudoduganella TaxID=2637179 RepID=UPI003F99EA8D
MTHWPQLVKAAYEQLVSEGAAVARPGAGTWLVTAPVASPSTALPNSGQPPSLFAARAREALKGAQALKPHGMRFDFQYGNPVHDPALHDQWRRSVLHALATSPSSYPPLQGVPELRHAVADYLRRRRGISCTGDDVLIVNGTQQALDLTARVLVEPGTPVALEEPCYFSVRQIFYASGAQLHLIPSDQDGMQVDRLPAPAPALISIAPANQFPSGAVLSGRRRQQLLQFAEQHGSYILEDDYDSELRFGANPLPALKASGDGERVIYSGTFSKIMFPALRLSYLVVPRSLQRDFASAKYLADMGHPALEQYAMAHFMAEGRFERHIARLVRSLAVRRAALAEGLAAIPRSPFVLAGGDRGTYLAAWLPGHTHAQAANLIAHAQSYGVGLYSLAPHYPGGEAGAGLLFGFAGLSLANLQAGTTMLGRCMEDARAQGLIP